MTPTTAQLTAEVAELKARVEALTRAAAERTRQEREITKPVGIHGDGAAAKAEADAHAAWKRSRGYGPQATPQTTLEDQTDEYQRAVAAALKAERDQKTAIEDRARINAARHAEAGTPELDAFQRAASSSQRQREVERSRPVEAA